MFLGVYAHNVGQWTPKRRAFVVRRWDWESLIENGTVRNCRLDCEVTCMRISLSHFTFIFYRREHQLYHGARFV